MGEDKSLLPFSTSNTLIEYQYKRLKPYFKDIYISSKIDKFDFLQSKEFLILDENKEIFSPILALNTIFNKFPNQKIFIITVDTPFVSIETISELINQSNEVDICIGETEKTHNLCGIFSSNINSFIKDMIENDIHKIFYLIKNSNHKIVHFDNYEQFININNKEEYIKSIDIINNSNI